MKRACALFGVALIVLLASTPVLAKSRNASVGNYYFEDTTTKDRKKIVVSKGDQVVFTVVQGIFPPHTVEVDELDIHSGAILQGQTYTTPKLDKVGSFLLYCDPHRERGHVSRLIVEASAPSASSPPRSSAAPSALPGAVTATSAPGPTTTPATMATPLTLEPLAVPDIETEDLPSGIGQADPDVLAQAPIDPDSLDGLLGRTVGGTQPWTRAIRWLVLATVPIVGAAVFALRRHAQLSAAAAVAEKQAAVKKKRKPPQRKKS